MHLIICVCCAATVSAQDRTALVVANFDYGEHQLSHVKADAAAVGEALRREGFRVTVAENVPGKELKSTVEQFARSTVTRGVAVLYFAGLGGQYQTYSSKGTWWTHLQGAGKPGDSKRLDRESLALADIVKLFADHSSTHANFLVLDAARPNPFLAERENQPGGLAAVEAAELADDTLLLWAAQPGRTAGALTEPSKLAAALAKHFSQGRESVGTILESVVKDVEQQSGGKQKPWLQVGRVSRPDRTGLETRPTSWPADDNRTFLDSDQPRDGSRPGQQWINASGIVFCWCPPGKFTMGVGQASSLSAGVGQAAERQAGSLSYGDAKPVEVTLSRGFWMAKYEAAQIEGRRAGWGPYPSITKGKLAPMHNLSHENPKKFIDMLTKAEQKAGRLPGDWEYALPTEAEWEYACRAGSTTRFSFGDDAARLHQFANFADKSLLADDGAMQFADARFDDGTGKALAPVGSYQPNAWGLHDMHGNVAEWCADRYLPQLIGGVDPLVDSKIKGATADGVIRGGAWCSTPEYCQSAFRNSEFAGKQRDYIGFRVVLRKK